MSKKIRVTKFILPLICLIVLIVLPLTGLPWYYFHVLFLFFTYLILAEMWNLLAGYCGLISLGQPAFIGLAGYMLAISLYYGLSLPLSLLVSYLTVIAFAIIISTPVFRLRGFYFVIGTWMIPEVLRLWFNNWRPTGEVLIGVGGGAGFRVWAGLTPQTLYYIALAAGFIAIILKRYILSSKLGVGLMAIRDDERAAESCGINVLRCKFYVFVIAALLTGVAGTIFYLFQGHIEPTNAFSIYWTNIMLIAVILGGIGTEAGPIIGTAIVVILEQILAAYGELSQIILGVLLIVIIVTLPKGILGTIYKTQIHKTLFKKLTTTS